MRKFLLIIFIIYSSITEAYCGPQLAWSTYIGGNYEDDISGFQVDSAGYSYIAGYTKSPGYPTTVGAYSRTFVNEDFFVTKLSSTGSSLIFSTFIGPVPVDASNVYIYSGNGLTIDKFGTSYITGGGSASFPTTSYVYNRNFNSGSGDPAMVFVTRLNSTGNNLIYSTFVGRGFGLSIQVDSVGNTYTAGSTNSSNFPIRTGSYDSTYGGNGDIFITKLNSDASILIYSTYLGGSSPEYFGDITIADSGAVYITGETVSNNFPTTPDAYRRSIIGIYDIFVSKLNRNGNSLLYSTYFGGSNSAGMDQKGYSIITDSEKNFLFTGFTRSNDFPVTSGAYDMSFNGNHDVILTKFAPPGDTLVFSTFVGGSDEDFGRRILLDNFSNIYLSGYSLSSDYPVTNFTTKSVHYDVVITELNKNCNSIIYSTYLGGNNLDQGYSIVLDSLNNMFVAGKTYSGNFPVTNNSYDLSFNGNYDIFVAKYNICNGLSSIRTVDSVSFFSKSCSQTYPQNDTFYIYNPSGSCFLSMNFMPITGKNASEFSIILPNSSSAFVNPKDSLKVVVQFNPDQTSDTNTAILTIQNNSANNPRIINLKGIIVISKIQADSNRIFPLIDCTSQLRDTFFVRNKGNCDITLTNDSISGTNKSEFQRLSPLNYPVTLAVGDSIRYIIAFNPNAISGTKTAKLSILNNSAAKILPVNLFGYKNTSVIQSDTAVNFSTIDCSAQLKDTVYVRNKGNCSLTIISDSIFGQNKSEFQRLAPLNYPITLAAGDSIRYIIVFDPSDTAGTKSAKIAITSNATQPWQINLTGISGAPKIQSKDNLTFSLVNCSPYVEDTFYVKNPGSCLLNLTDVLITGTGSPEFSRIIPDSLPAYVKPNDSLKFIVRFTPSKINGTKTAIMQILNNSVNTRWNINLSGTYKGPEIQSETVISFPTIECSSVAPATIFIKNTGDCGLILNSDIFSGVSKNEFLRLSPVSLPDTVAPGDSLRYIVQFTPNDTAAAKTAKLSILNSSGISPWQINLSGRSGSPQIQAQSYISVPSVVCPNGSSDYTFFVHNTGSCLLLLNDATFVGGYNKEFTRITPATMPVYVKPHDSIKFVIHFTPDKVLGLKTTRLILTNNTAVNPFIINLSSSKDSLAFTIDNSESDTIVIDIGTLCTGSKDTTIKLFNGSTIGTTFKIINTDPNLQIKKIDKAEKKDAIPLSAPKKKKK
jgi:hypothetical protein